MEYRVIQGTREIEHFTRYQLEGECGMVELIHAQLVLDGAIVSDNWTFVTHSVVGGIGEAEMCPTLKRAAWCDTQRIYEDDLAMRVIQSGQFRTAVCKKYIQKFGCVLENDERI